MLPIARTLIAKPKLTGSLLLLGALLYTVSPGAWLQMRLLGWNPADGATTQLTGRSMPTNSFLNHD